MVLTPREWWHRHGWTLTILLAAAGLAFAIRTIWTYPILQTFGNLYVYAGGSDSYYHSRVMSYIILNHHNLGVDPLLKYPLGAINPREPLFDWMNAILGLVFAPLFGGNAQAAGAFFLNLSGPLWSALAVFPIYWIGREALSKRAGLIAAVIFPFFPASIDSSIFGYGNYLAFYTFVILITVYAYLRTIKAAGTRRWVDSYRHPRSIVAGLRGFLAEERVAVRWAVFTGVCFGALAMAWQGYTYFVAVVAVFVTVMMLVERIRRIDSFGLYVLTWIVGLVGFPMAMPYYIAQHQFAGWFDTPLFLFFGTLALLLPFLLLRDTPWVFSVPFLVGLYLAGAAVTAIFLPFYFKNIVTGQGYFVKTLVYTTVAEVQAPSVDQLVVGYGLVTFFLAFAGLALAAWGWVRSRYPRVLTAFLVFAILSIYLPITAAKFFLIGTPAFALLAGEGLSRILGYGQYPELRRNVSALSDARGRWAAFRRALKPRHFLALLIVVGLLLPNVWFSIDAGIPGNTKGQVEAQVYHTLPSFLRPQSPSDIFGAAGTSIDTPNQYDSALYSWLAGQDTNLPPPQRPAFISWWDYGFQALDQGQHPVVADNFQNGIDPAGQFLLAQNESLGIGVLATALLYAETVKVGPTFPAALAQIVRANGLNVTRLTSYLVNTSQDYSLVVRNPSTYLPVNPATLTDDNAMYLVVSHYLASSLPLSGVARFYDDVQAFTGWSIRYDMVDMRLFPVSGSNTGIFYAPAELTGRIVDSAGVPLTFFNVTVLGTDGHTYPLGHLPANVGAVSYNINYFAPFYRSILYRTFVGYNGTQVGLSGGIPGLNGGAASSPIEPGWMMQHFQVIYRTAYYCPSSQDAATNPNCFAAMNLPTAVALANATGGIADTSPSSYYQAGAAMLEYYPGQTVLGRVTLPSGTPVGGARVTVYDSWHIPHMTAVTSPDGSFSLVLPPGNDTLNVTTGPLNAATQAGATLLKSVAISVPNAVGLSFNAPNLPLAITLNPGTVQGTVYWNTANSSTYNANVDRPVPGATVLLWAGGNTTPIARTADAAGTVLMTHVPPGSYHVSVLYGGQNYSEPSITVTPGSLSNISAGLPAGSISGAVSGPTGPVEGALVTLGNQSGSLVTTTSGFNGTFQFGSLGAGNYTVTARLVNGSMSSGGLFVSLRPGSKATVNLTLTPRGPVTVVVRADGSPAANVPVRFTPIATFASGSAPIGAMADAFNQSVVVTTNALGAASVSLPFGRYSAYALGTVGSRPYAGWTTVTVGSTAPSTVTLDVGPAVTISGSVLGTGGAPGARTYVEAFDSAGNAVAFATQPSGAFTLFAPAGTYSLWAISGRPAATTGLTSALATVSAPYSVSVSLTAEPAVAAKFVVGTSAARAGTILPVANASVLLSIGSSDLGLFAVANATGAVTIYVPGALPGGSTYCLSASGPGYQPTSQCNLTPTGLASLTQLVLPLTPVAVALTVGGVPVGTSVRVDFTVAGSTGANATVSGPSPLAVNLIPSTYRVRAIATVGSTAYGLNESPMVLTVPSATPSYSLALRLLPQVTATGTLTVPSGVAPAAVSITLDAPGRTTTVNGSAFTRGFSIAPGRYTLRATATVGSTAYAALGPVNVSAGGSIGPRVTLAAGGTLSAQLQDPAGASLAASASVGWVGSNGVAFATPTAPSGAVSLVVPIGTTLSAFANVTVLTTGRNGSAYVAYSAPAEGIRCTVSSAVSRCGLGLVPTTLPVRVNGTLTASGSPNPVPGTVRFTNAAGATTVVVAPNGTFSVALLPGAYSVYANASATSQPLANMSTFVATAGAASPLTIGLVPGWVAYLEAVPPAGLPTPANLSMTVTAPSGANASTGPIPFQTTVPWMLPVGTYAVAATAVGSPYGVATVANASTTVVVAQGNQHVTLSLAYRFQSSVNVTITGPDSARLPATGGNVSFAIAVRNTGNEPVSFNLTGAPAYWRFSFAVGRSTLAAVGPDNRTMGEMTIDVPSGTHVVHPNVVVQAVTSSGAVVGTLAPEPTLTIEPSYALVIAPAPAANASVGPAQVEVPFSLVNPGNIVETVSLSVSDAARLAGLGWQSSILNGAIVVTKPVPLSPGENLTLTLNLSATTSVAAWPGHATVTGAVLESGGGIVVSRMLGLPTTTVAPGNSTVSVNGPSLGVEPASYTVWLYPFLAFVPAIAIVAIAVVVQWNRTRRWTRR